MKKAIGTIAPLALASAVSVVAFLNGSQPSKADTLERIEMVAMRDGVRLSTRVFLPAHVPAGGLPALLMRTPYRYPGAGEQYADKIARFHAGRGYAFIVQDCRGRFGSEGTFKPFEGEIEDGRDTIEWLVSQSWSNGRVGTIGGSYNGFTALTAAVQNPRVATIVVDDPAVDFRYALRDGAVSMLPLFWLYLLDHGMWPSDQQKRMASNSLDVSDLDEQLLKRDSPFWNQYVAAEQSSQELWASRSVSTHLNKICAPTLIVKSRSEPWEDPVHIWDILRTAGCEAQRPNHRLIVTAESHTYHLTKLGFEHTQVSDEMLDWIDVWLGGKRDQASRTAPVRFRAPTDDLYHEAQQWPPASEERSLYLSNPAGMKANAPLADTPRTPDRTDSLEIRPESMDPCSNYPKMSYVSAPLKQPLYLAGAARGELWVSTTAADADVSVLIYEYNERDRQPLQYVTFGTARASAVTAVEPDKPFAIQLHMHSLAHEFRAGSQIAVAVTGSLCGYTENPHTGERPDRQSGWRSATYRIHHGARWPSRIVLPVLAAKARRLPA